MNRIKRKVRKLHDARIDHTAAPATAPQPAVAVQAAPAEVPIKPALAVPVARQSTSVGDHHAR